MAVSEKVEASPHELDPNDPTCLVLGDEHDGISAEVLKHCTTSVAIPMSGKTSSPNVGVAAGIVWIVIHL